MQKSYNNADRSEKPAQTNNTALTHPSSSGSLVIWAYLPQTTLPPAVTKPISDTLTSMMVPLVNTPNWVYIGDWGFFLTPKMGKKTVTPNSGCVTLAFFCLKAEGRMILSIFTGLRVKPSPTKVCFVIILFQDLDFDLPVFTTLNISSSEIPRTLGSGTENLSAFSILFCLISDEMALAVLLVSRSNKYVGRASPSSSFGVDGPLTLDSW